MGVSTGGRVLLRGIPLLFGGPLLFLALLNELVIADHLANGLLGARLRLFSEPIHGDLHAGWRSIRQLR
jgi:hypothetical protein